MPVCMLALLRAGVRWRGELGGVRAAVLVPVGAVWLRHVLLLCALSHVIACCNVKVLAKLLRDVGMGACWVAARPAAAPQPQASLEHAALSQQPMTARRAAPASHMTVSVTQMVRPILFDGALCTDWQLHVSSWLYIYFTSHALGAGTLTIGGEHPHDG